MMAAACSDTSRGAAPQIYVNSSNLLPNTPNQTLQVFIQGADAISGENLNFQINGADSGPMITGIDLITGTIFSSNGQSPTGPGIINSGTSSGRLAIVSVTTVSGTVVDNGILATLQVSTGPSSGGVFSLNMINTLNGASNLVLPNPSNTNSTISIAIQFPHNQFSIGSADRQWTVNGGGTWDTDSHWTPFAPYAQGDIANLLGAVTSGTAVITLDGPRTIGSLNFNDTAGSYNIAPGSGGSLQLNNGTNSPTVSDAAGTHLISAPMALSANTNVSVGTSGTLTVSGLISGPGNLSLSGGGKLLLTGVGNSYGATNIGAGSNLVVGNGTSSGSLGTGPINNSGLLTFGSVQSQLVATPLSGPGTVTIIGFLPLGTANTQNLTNITSSGTLEVDDPAGLLGAGTVSNGGSLVFNRTGSNLHSALIIGAGTLTQAGLGTTTLSAYQGTGPVALTAGKLAFASTSAPRQDTGVVVKMQSLTMGSTQVLDMTNHDLIIGNTSYAAVQSQIQAAFGAVSGPAITTSTSNVLSNGPDNTLPIPIDPAAFGLTSWDNVSITEPNSIIVKYTLFGDSTLDGIVNGDDFSVIAGNFGKTSPGISNILASWLMGDVTLDGFVNGDDFSVVAGNFGKGPLGTLDTPDAPAVVSSGGGSSNVPEPASLVLLGLGGASLFLLRSSRKRTKNCV